MELAGIAVVALIGFAIFFFVLKRLLKMAIRLSFFGAILVALVVGALAWWWYSPLESAANQNRNSAPRPARSNR
jgi:hypothetical protein